MSNLMTTDRKDKALMDPVQILSVAILAVLSLRVFREGRSSKKEIRENKLVSPPECLNFRVDQYAIDRMRDPTLPSIAKPIATLEEKESWLTTQAWSRSIAVQSSPWNDISSRDGVLHEYNCLETSIWTEQLLREFAKIGYDVHELGSKNLPIFRGLRVNDYLNRIDRVWVDFPSCELAVEKMTAGREQLRSLVQTLAGIHRIGLRVDTIPVWLLLQKKDDGEFFIPHIPQLRGEIFPSNFQIKMNPRLKAPAHLFGPKDENGPNPWSFQFQLGSFVWRLLAGEWPYDIEPLLLMRRENPQRVPHDFGARLTSTLERMTSLLPEERYPDLGVALEELAEALVAE